MLRPITLMILCGLLAGCETGVLVGSAERDFLCEAQEGSPCATIAAVDGHGANLQSVAEKPADTLAKSLSQEPLTAGKGGVSTLGDGGNPYQASLYREPERVGTLWIAPVLDESGTLHEARFVHFVISEGRWKS